MCLCEGALGRYAGDVHHGSHRAARMLSACELKVLHQCQQLVLMKPEREPLQLVIVMVILDLYMIA